MKLPLAILNVLIASPRAINPAVIRGFLPSFTGKDHTLKDIEHALRDLETKGFVKGTESQFHGVLWKITEDGRLEL